MRRLFVVVAVACVALCGAAGRSQADGYDYGAPAPVRSMPVPWTGFYLGAHLGGTWGSSTATDSTGLFSLNDSWSAAPSGLVFGATLGYNWQLGPVIYGLEGDLGNLGLAGSGGYYVPFGYDQSTTTDSDFYMTLRGRLGVLLNGWMLYFTAGYLGADTTVSVLDSCPIWCTTPVVGASNSGFRNGWTLGGGFEVGIEGPWTAKLEYLYYDLGAVSLTTPAGSGFGFRSWNVDTDGQLVRAGINYRFNTNTFRFGQ